MTRAPFAAVFAVLIVQRLHEVRVASRHTAALRARGAIEFGAGHYPVMVAMHAAWFVVWLVEVLLQGVRLGWWSVPCAAVTLAAEALRQWAVHTLGARWTTRVLALSGDPPIHDGPYRWLRHPNYLAVFTQLVALPLVFGAWVTAVFGALSYAGILAVRLRAEGEALRWMCAASSGPGGGPGRPAAAMSRSDGTL